jgi:hypothetical protein
VNEEFAHELIKKRGMKNLRVGHWFDRNGFNDIRFVVALVYDECLK